MQYHKIKSYTLLSVDEAMRKLNVGKIIKCGDYLFKITNDDNLAVRKIDTEWVIGIHKTGFLITMLLTNNIILYNL